MKHIIRYILTGLLSVNILNADIVISFDIQNSVDSKQPTPAQKIDIEKIKQIAKTHNIKVTFKPTPWKRSLLMLEKGLVDGVINASYKTNRAKYANYPMKNGTLDGTKKLNDGNSYYIYKHKNSNIKWDGKKFINSGTVAVMEKYAVIDDLEKHSNITIKTFLNNSEIIRKVASGQIDAYAGSTKITDRLLKKYSTFAKNIVRESLPIRKKDYFLIFSKKTYNKKIEEMEIIWTGLQKFNEKK